MLSHFPRFIWLKSLLIGVQKPAAAGRMTDACLSLPTVVWNFFTGVRFLFKSCLVSFTYCFAFSLGNLTFSGKYVSKILYLRKREEGLRRVDTEAGIQ